MSDLLKTQKQVAILAQWREEIDTCTLRLEHAAGNAVRAIDRWQQFVSQADPSEAQETGQSVAVELLQRESSSLTHLATLCRTFAAATGQTNDHIITKLTAALSK
jgi:hypothetical protein